MAPEFDYFFSVEADVVAASEIVDRLRQVEGSGHIAAIRGEQSEGQESPRTHIIMRADHPAKQTVGNIVDITGFVEMDKGLTLVEVAVLPVMPDPHDNIWDPEARFGRLTESSQVGGTLTQGTEASIPPATPQEPAV